MHKGCPRSPGQWPANLGWMRRVSWGRPHGRHPAGGKADAARRMQPRPCRVPHQQRAEQEHTCVSPATTLLRDKCMVKGKIKSAAGKRGGWDRSAPQGRQKEARPLAGLRLCCRCHKWDQDDQGTLRSRRAWGVAHYRTALHPPMTARVSAASECAAPTSEPRALLLEPRWAPRCIARQPSVILQKWRSRRSRSDLYTRPRPESGD